MDKLKILIAAEREGLGEFIFTLLEERGFEVEVIDARFESAKVLSELSRETYGIVVLTNNCFIAKQLPNVVSDAKTRYPDVYIVVLTGCYEADLVAELYKQGADDCLPMPINTEDFLGCIEAV